MGGGSYPPYQRTLPQSPSASFQLSRCPQTGLAAYLLCCFVRSLHFSICYEITMKRREVTAGKEQMQMLEDAGGGRPRSRGDLRLPGGQRGLRRRAINASLQGPGSASDASCRTSV